MKSVSPTATGYWTMVLTFNDCFLQRDPSDAITRWVVLSCILLWLCERKARSMAESRSQVASKVTCVSIVLRLSIVTVLVTQSMSRKKKWYQHPWQTPNSWTPDQYWETLHVMPLLPIWETRLSSELSHYFFSVSIQLQWPLWIPHHDTGTLQLKCTPRAIFWKRNSMYLRLCKLLLKMLSSVYLRLWTTCSQVFYCVIFTSGTDQSFSQWAEGGGVRSGQNLDKGPGVGGETQGFGPRFLQAFSISIVRLFLTQWRRITSHSESGYWAGVTGRQGMLAPPRHLIPPPVFPVVCSSPMISLTCNSYLCHWLVS
jgi:hypothetical protein